MRMYFFFIRSLDLYLFIFFLSCSCKTSLWIVQMYNSACLLGNAFKCQLYSLLIFSIMFFSFCLPSVRREYKNLSALKRQMQNEIYPCALHIQYGVADFYSLSITLPICLLRDNFYLESCYHLLLFFKAFLCFPLCVPISNFRAHRILTLCL